MRPAPTSSPGVHLGYGPASCNAALNEAVDKSRRITQLCMTQMCVILFCVMANNPFRYGEVVTQEDFCTRAKLVTRLRDYLAAGHNAVLIGERRTGKTSLIQESARRQRGLRLIYAQFWAVKSVADVANRLLRGISSMQAKGSWLERVGKTLGHLRPKIDFDPVTGQPSITITPGAKVAPEGLHGVFDLIEELAVKHRVAVALDEFQDIRDVPDADALLGEIRGRIQQQKKVGYLFAGSIRHEMERIFRDPSQPFFKSLRVVDVGPIDRKTFQGFLERRFKTGRRKVSVEAYDEIFEIAEDNPSDVQQLCSSIWETTIPGEKIASTAVQVAVRHTFSSERKGYESLVKFLTGQQQNCLRALARVGGKHPQSKDFLAEAGIPLPSSVKRALTRLVELELVYDSDLDYKFYDPFFRQWIAREF